MKVVYKHTITRDIRQHRQDAMMMNREIEKIVLTGLEADALAAELTEQTSRFIMGKDINGMTYMGVKLEVK